MAIAASRFRAGKDFDCLRAVRACESGGKRAAVQTLRAGWGVRWSRQHLDCGDFSTALMRAKIFLCSIAHRADESGVALPSTMRFDAARRFATAVQDARARFDAGRSILGLAELLRLVFDTAALRIAANWG